LKEPAVTDSKDNLVAGMWDVKGLTLTTTDAGKVCVLIIPKHIPGPLKSEEIFEWSSNEDGT
jgi:hypothetical protein